MQTTYWVFPYSPLFLLYILFSLFSLHSYTTTYQRSNGLYGHCTSHVWCNYNATETGETATLQDHNQIHCNGIIALNLSTYVLVQLKLSSFAHVWWRIWHITSKTITLFWYNNWNTLVSVIIITLYSINYNIHYIKFWGTQILHGSMSWIWHQFYDTGCHSTIKLEDAQTCETRTALH
jgi:hypothetical protein